MTELQASLLIIGGIVVAGVYAFNWLQEHRLRRRLEEAFGTARDDALMQETAAEAVEERVEPQLQTVPDEEEASSAEVVTSVAAEPEMPAPERAPAAVTPGASPFDEALDFVAEIQSAAVIPEASLEELLSKTAASGKPCRAAGFSEARGEWEELARAAGSRYARVQVALQLVNRSGPVGAPQLTAFCDAVRSCAGKISAQVACGDPQQALQRARELDILCAELDVAIGVNIIAPEDRVFAGSRIRGLAEAAGFKLEPDGVFHFRGAQRRTLFTLDNHEPAPFIPEQIKTVTTGGVTLLLDVPRVADGRNALKRMLEIGGQLARGLGGQLVDDNRVALNEHAVAGIEKQLEAIASRMAASGFEAGGERALRLFS